MRARSLTFVTGLILVVTAACGGPRPSATSEPTTLATPPSPVSSPTSAATAASPPIAGSIDIDAGLLDLLPDTVAGLRLKADAATATEMAAGAGLPDIVAIAVGFYGGAEDYAVVVVARVRPEVIDDDWFADWRMTFDEGVCEVAGGVDPGASVTESAGKKLVRSTCREGVVIRHVWLVGSDVIVSLQGAGPADIGERVVEGLTE